MNLIHKYKFKDQYIVMDVNSGAVHVVNNIVYDILDYYNEKSTEEIVSLLKNKYNEQEILEAIEDIKYLIDNEMLYTDDSQVTMDMLEGRGAIIKAMCLHVAHDCNMNCKYCFGDKGAFEGIRSLLPLETGKKAIDFLLTHSGTRRNLELDFFGGEPLMNFEVVKELVKYGREAEKQYGKNIRFTITTNGLLLDEDKSNFINENMSNVILSIDGRPEVNDKMRRTVNDKGTYDVIMENYLNFVKKRKGTYYVRGTFTRENLDFSEDVKHLVEKGFKSVSVEPVVTDLSYSYALQDEDKDRIFKEYEKLSDLFLDYHKNGKTFEFFHYNVDLNQGPCVIKRVSGCGAGTEYVAVTPEGDIYPCHQFVGNTDFLIGNVNNDHFENRLYDEFNKAHIYNKEKCNECWAKFYCSGGCHANAYNMNKDIRKPYELGCEMEKKRIECAVGIKAVISCQEEEEQICKNDCENCNL
ncbi:thioether cross-link-forming SCIFF peptide maturase [Anaerovorax odorimutans]|uniref:thioether cross-link-forming SCIFF peptide maturase n=1 Tax=Anaerovorax odorimutans TaxID=109327 RepID=UPI000A077066